MKRSLFNITCILSLLLCAAAIFLLIRSYRSADYLVNCRDTSEFGVISTVGRFIIYDESAINPFRWNGPFGFQYATRPAPDSITAYTMPNTSGYWNFMGFGAIWGDNGRYRASAVFVPYWFVAGVTAILPLIWIRRRLRRRARGFAVEIPSAIDQKS